MNLSQLESAALKGDKEAQYLLAEAISDEAYEKEQPDFEIKLKLAFEWFQKSAMQNHPGAQCEAGKMLLAGNGVEENEKDGLELLQKSAEHGYAPAQIKLGSKLQESGDLEKARYWYDKAIELGVPSIQRECAELLFDEDLEQASSLYQSAAEAGDAQAQFKLAELYQEGNGFPKNEEEAFHWYTEAEKQCYRNFPDDASYEVGRCYASGSGVGKNPDEALTRLLSIADPRLTNDSWTMPRAQFWVANVFADAVHDRHDLVESYAWFNLAATYASEGQELYAKFRETIGERLTKEQQGQAQRRSKELFVPRKKIEKRLGFS